MPELFSLRNFPAFEVVTDPHSLHLGFWYFLSRNPEVLRIYQVQLLQHLCEMELSSFVRWEGSRIWSDLPQITL